MKFLIVLILSSAVVAIGAYEVGYKAGYREAARVALLQYTKDLDWVSQQAMQVRCPPCSIIRRSPTDRFTTEEAVRSAVRDELLAAGLIPK
jgi:hypothetical protein